MNGSFPSCVSLRPRTFAWALLGVLALLLSLGGHGLAQEGETAALEAMVPADTIVFVSFPDLGKAREQWKETALYRIWTDNEVAFAVDKLLGNFEEFKKELEGEFHETTGVELTSALDLLKGQLSFALVKLPNPQGESDADQMPRAAFAIDFGKQKETLLKLMDFAKKAVGDGQDLVDGKISVAGREVYTFGDKDFMLHYAFLGTTLLVTTDKGTMEWSLTARSGQEAKTLAGHEAFRHVRKTVHRGGSEAVFIYADFPGLSKGVGSFLGMEDEGLGRSLKALGTDNVKSLGLSVAFGQGGVSDALYLHAPGPKNGLLKILSLSQTATPHLHLVPGDAISYTGLRLDIGKIWDTTLEMVKAFDEDAHKEIQEEIQKFNEKTGVNVRDDLIGAMGDEISSFGAFPKGGGIIPESVTIFSLRQPAKFEEAYRKLMESAGMERKELAFRDRTIRYFTAKMGGEPGAAPREPGGPGGGPRLPESPIPGIDMDSLLLLNLTSFQNYFIEGNYIFLSNLAQSLKGVVTKMDGGDRFVSLSRNPHYSRLMKHLPGNPGLVMYADLRGIFNLIYNTLLPLGQMGELLLRRELGVPFENAVLPRAEAVSQHLTPSITGVTSTADGVLVTSYSTTGVTTIGLTAVAVAGVGAGIFMGMGGADKAMSRSSANETMAIATLKSISTAQEMFKNMAVVDQDKDGVGEYGFFQELAGTQPTRAGKKVDAPFVPRMMGYPDDQGRVSRAGYYFRIFLPGEKGAMTTGFQVPGASAKAADGQESRYCVYAWPIQSGVTGDRTFIINETGVILFTYASVKRYSGNKGPAPDAAYDRKGKNPKNLEGKLAVDGAQASDAEFWAPVGK